MSYSLVSFRGLRIKRKFYNFLEGNYKLFLEEEGLWGIEFFFYNIWGRDEWGELRESYWEKKYCILRIL